jgi:hypothetical protein
MFLPPTPLPTTFPARRLHDSIAPSQKRRTRTLWCFFVVRPNVKSDCCVPARQASHDCVPGRTPRFPCYNGEDACPASIFDCHIMLSSLSEQWRWKHRCPAPVFNRPEILRHSPITCACAVGLWAFGVSRIGLEKVSQELHREHKTKMLLLFHHCHRLCRPGPRTFRRYL